jgi:hypothetical protein
MLGEVPMVGIRITPTNSWDRPNCSMNGSIAPTRISDRSARTAAVTSNTPTATFIVQGGPPWPSLSPWPPRVRSGFVNCQTSERI